MLILYLMKFKYFIYTVFFKILYLQRLSICFDTIISGLVFIKSHGKISIKNNFSSRMNLLLNASGGHISIGSNVFFNNDCQINCHEFIEIGDNCIFGPGLKIFDHDHAIYNSVVSRINFNSQPIVIGQNVWVGANVLILKGVTIGDNVIIAAGSVVTKNISTGTVFCQKR